MVKSALIHDLYEYWAGKVDFLQRIVEIHAVSDLFHLFVPVCFEKLWL